jgi:methyl-CpG-binding domain protein 4
MIRSGWLPPVSPHGLLQETLFPNEWLILISCMMLNCTQRRQVEQVLPSFIKRWPDPHAFLRSSIQDVIDLCRPLGFANKRSSMMLKMTKAYVEGRWSHASELPGIGEYGSRSWEIFCRGVPGDTPPNDHALTKYWIWLTQ